jgi:hypothetical protein
MKVDILDEGVKLVKGRYHLINVVWCDQDFAEQDERQVTNGSDKWQLQLMD